jgi:hypothetical protein
MHEQVAYNYFYDSFGAIAGRDFIAGTEVLISYGKRSNDHLLQYYGFVEQDNPHDVYIIQDFFNKVDNCQTYSCLIVYCNCLLALLACPLQRVLY